MVLLATGNSSRALCLEKKKSGSLFLLFWDSLVLMTHQATDRSPLCIAAREAEYTKAGPYPTEQL